MSESFVETYRITLSIRLAPPQDFDTPAFEHLDGALRGFFTDWRHQAWGLRIKELGILGVSLAGDQFIQV